MTQSDGKNKLRRIEFVFNGKSYKFILNPEEYQIASPNRANLTQTKAGAWIDEFGEGIPTIQFKGTTGFKNGSSDPTKGFQKLVELRNYIKKVFNRVEPGQTVPASKELLFYNHTDGEYFVVTPTTFDVMRSVARPNMYTYNISLICQRPISMPKGSDISSTSSITSERKYSNGK